MGTPEAGDEVHSILTSGRTAVFRVTEVRSGIDKANYIASVTPVGFLEDLEEEHG